MCNKYRFEKNAGKYRFEKATGKLYELHEGAYVFISSTMKSSKKAAVREYEDYCNAAELNGY